MAHAVRAFPRLFDLFFPAPYRFHDTALLIRDISYPVALSSRDDEMPAPAIDLAVQLVRFVDCKLAW